MQYIRDVVFELLEDYTTKELVEELEITPALLSTWKQKDNDFCPRIGLATKIYKLSGHVVYPYDERALESLKDRV